MRRSLSASLLTCGHSAAVAKAPLLAGVFLLANLACLGQAASGNQASPLEAPVSQLPKSSGAAAMVVQPCPVKQAEPAAAETAGTAATPATTPGATSSAPNTTSTGNAPEAPNPQPVATQ